VELFENTSLNKAFQSELAIERKIPPRARTPQSRPNSSPSNYQPTTSNPSARFTSPHPQNPTANTCWCTFHKTSLHNIFECRVLKSMKTNKTLFTEHISAEPVENNEEVPLDNPTEVDPSLILMNTDEQNSSTQPLFTHNFQINNSLALLIVDNGSQKNLVSQELVDRLQLTTTPHPKPYHLGWVRKDGP